MSYRFLCSPFVAVAALLTLGSLVSGQDWPQWRGPHFNGSSSAVGLPDTWSRVENVRWATKLPGPAEATPVVIDDKVFVSSTDPANDALVALCVDRKSGEILWKHVVARGIRTDSRSTYAGPSPVASADRVIFFYGNGELAAWTHQGTRVWRRNIQDDFGPFAFNWTFSSSPLLYEGRLYLQVLQRDVPVDGRGLADRENKSYLLAIEPASGDTIWQRERPSNAKAESREAFTTPVPLIGASADELLVVGGDDLTGHDLATGEELWRWGTWNPTRIGHWRLVPSPVSGGGVILACAPKSSPIYAVPVGQRGSIPDASLAWISDGERAVTSDVPTPAYYDGHFFILSDVRKRLSRVEPATGKVVWSVATPGRIKYEASPMVADGKVYAVNFVGEVSVFNAADGDLLNTAAMADPAQPFEDFSVRSTVIAAHGELFIRTNSELFCIAK